MEQEPILLIWEEIPESIKIFWLENLNQDDWKKIIASHGTFMGMNETDNTRFVSDFIYDSANHKYKFPFIYNSDNDLNEPKKIDCSCRVVVCGFAL